ncbi:MAG: four helix bundle protein [bacterium]|nr:four helix bundle protein [bacterium]
MDEVTQKINSFLDLDAWKEGHKLVLMIYEVTKFFLKEEMFGLVSQMRRSAVSITSNIAEGFSRQSYKEKTQFYSISLGSVTELQNQAIIKRDIGYINEEVFLELDNQLLKVHKIINGLIKKSRSFLPYS